MDARPTTDEETPTQYLPRLPRTECVRLGSGPLVRKILSVEGLIEVALKSRDLAAAEAHSREAIRLRQVAGAAARRGLPQAFGRLALVAVHGGKLSEAFALLELALELARAQRPCLAACDAALLHNLGSIASRLGRLQEAESHYVAALAVKVPRLGWSHPSVAHTLVSQGFVLLRLKQPADALDCFERARLIYARCSGELSLEMSHLMMGCGAANLMLGQAAIAEQVLVVAHAVRELIPVQPVQLGRTRFLLARARWHRDPVGARLLAEQALRDSERSLRPDRRTIATIRTWIERHAPRTA